MKKAAILLLMAVYGCASIPYNGKYTLNGEDVDYTMEKNNVKYWQLKRQLRIRMDICVAQLGCILGKKICCCV